MTELSTTEVGTSEGTSRYAAAAEQLKAPMLALSEAELEQINVDIPSAVSRVLGALPEIMALRPRATLLAEFDIQNFDLLEPAALALQHNNTVYAMVTKPEEPIASLADQCFRLVQVLKADAQTLALRGIIDGSALSQLRGGHNYGNLVFDLFALAYLLRSNWTTIQGRTALQLDELAEAEQLADRLSIALGLKQQAPAAAAPASDMRQRSFTLFSRTLDQVERALRFLLSPAQFREVMPNIHVPRGPAKKRVAAEPEAPAQTGVHPAVPAASSAAHGTDAAVAEPEQLAAVGMPGSNPYKV